MPIEELNKCQDCSCSCQLISDECLVQLSEIPKASIVKINHFNNATDDLDDLIGVKCSDELCLALKKAVEAVEEEEAESVLEALPEKWRNLVENRHFKKWYANRVSYHYFEGSSITQLKAVGLVTTSNDDEEYKNGFRHAEESQRKRLQDAAANYASHARKKFLEHFWNCSDDYDCRPEECCKKDKPGGKPVGFTII